MVERLKRFGEIRLADLRLAGLNNVSGLWGLGAILSCLVPGWGIAAPECKSLIEEVGGTRQIG